MKKLIVMNNGEKRVMEFEEILNQFRGVALKELLKYKNGGAITEDDLQEMDIVIFKALKSYDEYHCFTTHLTWKLRQYFTHTAVNAKRQKRDTSAVTILNLDMKVSDGKGGNEMDLHEMLTDDAASFEDKLMDQAFIAYIASNLDDFEMKLLAVNLGNMRVIDLADEYNTSKQNINNKNRRFKAKLLQLINDFNA
nr:hypothetical protein [uncultured Lachnoclostridium sp.]